MSTHLFCIWYRHCGLLGLPPPRRLSQEGTGYVPGSQPDLPERAFKGERDQESHANCHSVLNSRCRQHWRDMEMNGLSCHLYSAQKLLCMHDAVITNY